MLGVSRSSTTAFLLIANAAHCVKYHELRSRFPAEGPHLGRSQFEAIVNEAATGIHTWDFCEPQFSLLECIPRGGTSGSRGLVEVYQHYTVF